LEARPIERYGLTSPILMENAAKAQRYFQITFSPTCNTRTRCILADCPGNNGGDGLIMARHLAEAGAMIQHLPLERAQAHCTGADIPEEETLTGWKAASRKPIISSMPYSV